MSILRIEAAAQGRILTAAYCFPAESRLLLHLYYISIVSPFRPCAPPKGCAILSASHFFITSFHGNERS